MSHPHDPISLRPVAIDRNGCISVFGRRYWSADLHKFSREIHEIRVSAAPHHEALVVSARGAGLCRVVLIEDTGFSDPSAAQDRVQRERRAIEDIAHELGEKTVECSDDRASVVSRDAEAIPQFADDRVEHVGFGSKIFGYCRRALPFRLFNRIRAAAGKMPVERPDVSDETPARAHGDRLYHIQAILKHVQALIQIERHLLSPSDCESHQPSETGDVAHRLSEGGQ